MVFDVNVKHNSGQMFLVIQVSTLYIFVEKNYCLSINAFVFFSGIVSLIHLCLIYSLITYLRYTTGWNTLVCSIATTGTAIVRLVRYI